MLLTMITFEVPTKVCTRMCVRNTVSNFSIFNDNNFKWAVYLLWCSARSLNLLYIMFIYSRFASICAISYRYLCVYVYVCAFGWMNREMSLVYGWERENMWDLFTLSLCLAVSFHAHLCPTKKEQLVCSDFLDKFWLIDVLTVGINHSLAWFRSQNCARSSHTMGLIGTNV